MAGLSSNSPGKMENKFKYGGKELSSNDFSDGTGLGNYDFHARNYDPLKAILEALLKWSTGVSRHTFFSPGAVKYPGASLISSGL